MAHAGFIIVDEQDINKVTLYGKWHIDNKGYVCINKQINGKQHNIKLHRFILGLSSKDKVQVDHINGNRADNHKSNLRIVNNSQNQMNKRLLPSNISGYAGVTWRRSRKRGVARIRKDNILYNLGSFKDISRAITVRKNAEKILFKEYARNV